MVPVGLDEGDEALACGGEIVDRFLGQDLDGALRLGTGRLHRVLGARLAQARDLVVQRGVHV